MQTKRLLAAALCAGILSLGLASSQAQTQAIWIGPSSGAEWNTPADWSTALPPGADVNGTTNAWIGPSTNVSYNLPMSAAGFGILTNYGVLNLNTNGFNCSAIYLINPNGGDKLFLTNSGTIVNVNGAITMSTNATALLAGGAHVNVGSLVVDANTSSHAGGVSAFTNSGGFLTANSTTVNNNQGTGTGLLLINGGANNLGNTAVGRNNSGAGGTGLGNEGLVIYSGVVTMTNLNLGNAGQGLSSLSGYITGGLVTNYGSVFINQGSSGRFSRFLQTGGLFVVPDPGVVNPNPTVSGSVNNYTINGGTNIVGGFFLGNSNNSAGNVNFTNAAAIYVGSQGINWNGAVTLNAMLNGGALFGATTDWTNNYTALKLNGGNFTFQAADPNGTAHNITLFGPLTGNGGFTKTGNGTLTLAGTNTYTGNTTVNNGTLVLGAGGVMGNTLIVTTPGTTFDVSALGGGYSPTGLQILGGFGSVNGLVTATNGTIQPGSNTVTGTLTLLNTLTEPGGALNKFVLSADPVHGSNDLLAITGDLDVSGTNTVTVVGSLPNGTNYTLITYTGNFNGNITNFALVGATGYLTNLAAANSIVLHTLATTRGPANTVWDGNPLNNFWDDSVTTNWLNAGVLDFFITGDSVRFDNTGASNNLVIINGDLFPASVTVDSISNYVFSGNGIIDGTTGLTKTNSGTLTVLTTNSYGGATVISGGTLEALLIAATGSPSSIGETADTDPSLLVLTNGGTLRYIGATAANTDRGITAGGGAIAVTNGSTLTLNGTVTGPGLLTKTDNGELQLNSPNNNSGGVTISGGMLSLPDAGGAGSGTITANSGTTLRIIGALTVGNQFSVPSGTVTVDLDNAGGNTALDGAWSGGGTVNITNMENSSRTFTLGGNGSGGGSMVNFSGTVECGTVPGSVRFNDGGGNGNTGSTNMTLDLGTSTAVFLVRNGGITINIGALLGGSSTSLSGRGSGSSGTVTYSIGAKNLGTEYAGIIKDGGNATAIAKVGTGSLVLAGQSTYTGNTTVSSGMLVLTNDPNIGSDASINDSASINITTGTVLDVSSLNTPYLQVGSSATQIVEGRGTITGGLTVGSSGTVAPGGGPGGNTGTLTVTNAVTLTGTAWMKLNRGNTPNSDQVVSSLSTITYGGTLVVTNIGAGLHAGDTFTLFSGGGLSGGTFSTVVLPNYYVWNTGNLGVNGSISVTSLAPLPAITNVDFSGLSGGTITLNADNGTPNGPVVVVTSTNLLGAWTPVVTNSFDSSGNLSQSVTVDPTLPQSFYMLQAY